MSLIRVADLAAAANLLTRLPIPGDHAVLGARMAASGWAWPLVGAAVGAAGGLALAVAAALGVVPLAAAALALAVQLWITGALHEDGLSDCADGFGGGRTVDRRLEIMRDSRIGAFGAAALALALLARAGMLATLAAGAALAAVAVCAAAGALARASLPMLLRAGPQARSGGMAAAVGRPAAATAAAAIAVGAALAAALCGWSGLLAAGLAFAVAAATLSLARRRIGGVTGDVLGAAAALAEIAALAVLTAR
jgi:adenosylcobinamide-GDP ribazoletransferase